MSEESPPVPVRANGLLPNPVANVPARAQENEAGRSDDAPLEDPLAVDLPAEEPTAQATRAEPAVSEPVDDEPRPEVGAPVASGPADREPESRESEETEPELRTALEAILMVVDEPVAEIMLAQILERPRDEVVATLHELAAEYTAQGRGFDLREVAGGWRFYTRSICAPLVERFVRDGQQARLTQAALETLAVVAYRQPVSRARVSAIRGVNSDGVIRTLTVRGLIEEAGQDPEHQAILYQTTSYFLERLGLRGLDELPDLAPFLPDDVAELEEQEP